MHLVRNTLLQGRVSANQNVFWSSFNNNISLVVLIPFVQNLHETSKKVTRIYLYCSCVVFNTFKSFHTSNDNLTLFSFCMSNYERNYTSMLLFSVVFCFDLTLLTSAACFTTSPQCFDAVSIITGLFDYSLPQFALRVGLIVSTFRFLPCIFNWKNS